MSAFVSLTNFSVRVQLVLVSSCRVEELEGLEKQGKTLVSTLFISTIAMGSKRP